MQSKKISCFEIPTEMPEEFVSASEAKEMMSPPPSSVTSETPAKGRLMADGSIAASPSGLYKRARWTENDKKRLKLMIKLSGVPRHESDWEFIAWQANGRHTATECREMCEKMEWNEEYSTDSGEESGDAACYFERELSSNRNSLALSADDSMFEAFESPTKDVKRRRRPFIAQVLNASGDYRPGWEDEESDSDASDAAS